MCKSSSSNLAHRTVSWWRRISLMTFTWLAAARVNLSVTAFPVQLVWDMTLCSLLDPVGHCVANEKYIGQLKETFATSVPSRIAAFFGEPIQVQHSCSMKQSIFLESDVGALTNNMGFICVFDFFFTGSGWICAVSQKLPEGGL